MPETRYDAAATRSASKATQVLGPVRADARGALDGGGLEQQRLGGQVAAVEARPRGLEGNPAVDVKPAKVWLDERNVWFAALLGRPPVSPGRLASTL